MKDNSHSQRSLLGCVILVAVLPLVVILMVGFERRSLIKDGLSLLIILSYSLMIGQFLWCGWNRKMFTGRQSAVVLGFHTLVGYTFCLMVLLHPFFLVLPRFFEDGMNPSQAFLAIITTFGSRGIVLGWVAWGLLMVLGLLSLLRKILPFRYITWRRVHGLLGSLCILTATWHAVDLGRHFDTSLSLLFIGSTLTVVFMYLYNSYSHSPLFSGR